MEKSSPKEVIITRVFDAPRELVWKAWMTPEMIKNWWGPKGYTSPTCQIDFQVGGKYLFCMRSPEGKTFWSTGVYREIIPIVRIIATDSFADAQGNVVSAAHYSMGDDFPIELQIVVTFEDENGKTKLTLKHVGIPEGQMTELTKVGWNQSFDKLARLVEA